MNILFGLHIRYLKVSANVSSRSAGAILEGVCS